MDDDLLRATTFESEKNVNKARDFIDKAGIRKQFPRKLSKLTLRSKLPWQIEALPSVGSFPLVTERTCQRRFVYPHAPFDEIYHVKSVSPAHDFLYLPQKWDEHKKNIKISDPNSCKVALVQITQARVRVRLTFVNKNTKRIVRVSHVYNFSLCSIISCAYLIVTKHSSPKITMENCFWSLSWGFVHRFPRLTKKCARNHRNCCQIFHLIARHPFSGQGRSWSQKRPIWTAEEQWLPSVINIMTISCLDCCFKAFCDVINPRH